GRRYRRPPRLAPERPRGVLLPDHPGPPPGHRGVPGGSPPVPRQGDRGPPGAQPLQLRPGRVRLLRSHPPGQPPGPRRLRDSAGQPTRRRRPCPRCPPCPLRRSSSSSSTPSPISSSSWPWSGPATSSWWPRWPWPSGSPGSRARRRPRWSCPRSLSRRTRPRPSRPPSPSPRRSPGRRDPPPIWPPESGRQGVAMSLISEPGIGTSPMVSKAGRPASEPRAVPGPWPDDRAEKGAAEPGDSYVEPTVTASDATNAPKRRPLGSVASPAPAWSASQNIRVSGYRFTWNGTAWAAGVITREGEEAETETAEPGVETVGFDTYDPNEHTVAEITEWAATASDEELDAALELEEAGKNRSGAVAVLGG